MNHKITLGVFLLAAVVSMLVPAAAFAQNAFERALKLDLDTITNEKGVPGVQANLALLPNDAVQSVMTPTGWGGNGAYIFGGIGGTYPAVYTNKPDLIGAVGFCVGNSVSAVNFAASVNVTKISTLDDLSANFILSRRIGKASSISIGGLQLFANNYISDAPGATFYFAVSHSFQWARSRSYGYSSLSYTIGFGNGRFLLKSPYDIAAGKGKYGTGLFGNLSYELLKRVNINLEWTGMNLGFSTGIRPFSSSALSFGVGVSNLTTYSSDKPSMVFSLGYPLSLSRSLQHSQPKKNIDERLNF